MLNNVININGDITISNERIKNKNIFKIFNIYIYILYLKIIN